MPSPFPGMDPYLENPAIWPDFHHRLATEVSSDLNQKLPAPYYARVEMRPEIGIVDEDEEVFFKGYIVPDVLVVRRPRRSPSPAKSENVAVAVEPRTEISDWLEIEWPRNQPQHHYFIEIRDAQQGHKLITLIEILSPSNKCPGPDRRAYAKKQLDVLSSDANLVEIDLLRGGQRVYPHTQMESFINDLKPRPHYLVAVSRAWERREESIETQIFAFRVRNSLPCIPVPLRESLPEPPLDLQFEFCRAYEGGPYQRGAVDYTQPPDPPLGEADATWAAALLREQGLRPAPPK